MKTLTLINLIANCLITIGLTFFTIGIFGRRSKTVEGMTLFEKIFVKAALAVSAAGSLFNCLTFSTPNDTEILLNVGFGMLFVWAAWFHWKFFVNGTKAGLN